MDTTFLEKALTATEDLRVSLIRQAKDEKDALAIATAFTLEAARIYRELGGEKLVAAQFYNVADDATNKLPLKAERGDNHGL